MILVFSDSHSQAMDWAQSNLTTLNRTRMTGTYQGEEVKFIMRPGAWQGMPRGSKIILLSGWHCKEIDALRARFVHFQGALAKHV